MSNVASPRTRAKFRAKVKPTSKPPKKATLLKHGKSSKNSQGKKKHKKRKEPKFPQAPLPPLPTPEVPLEFANARQIFKGTSVVLQEPTEDLVATMAMLVKVGNHPPVAAAALGVPGTVYQGWIEKGLANPDSIYGRLLVAMEAAEAQSECTDIELITLGVKHASDLQWKRERRSAGRWGSRNTQLFAAAASQTITKVQTEQSSTITVQEGAAVLSILESVGYIPQAASDARVAPSPAEPDSRIVTGQPLQ